MSSEILDLHSTATSEDSITGIQYHAYNPYTNSFKNSDEIHIVIQHQDLYVLPHESYIYIEARAKVTPAANATAAQQVAPCYVNNAASFLFDEIRYELNGFLIDSCKNVGITSSVKGYATFQPKDMSHMEIASWKKESNKTVANESVNFCIPLANILGFTEDYRNIVMNAKHELILVRSRSDTNCYVGANNIASLEIQKIQWRIPHVAVSDTEKLKLMKIIDKKQPIQLNFRSWELYEYPTVPNTMKHIWSVKTSAQLNTPRYIIVAFQTNRNNRITADKSRFDHCQLSDLKVYLNSECFPYENLNVNFGTNVYAVLYDMYVRFQKTFYHDRQAFAATPLLTFEEYKNIAPIFVIDCSRQNESLKKSIVDIRIEIETRVNFEDNTSAYCIIIHDNMIAYNPYTNIVNRIM
ncbi:uncharacterized protein LOC116347322 [Contarinia nasturtii]|uniref:uncharacterized protein LOC116347322 n=1 Tax=Contarinia nasturtii TaxID=265458 RepID=UPI0012D4020A|nr:uncharacterized protein LOC116347322 [Contarinia nasturtii]